MPGGVKLTDGNPGGYRLRMGEQQKLRRYRRRAFDRQAGLCYWCKKPMVTEGLINQPRMCTADHLIRRVDGGVTIEANIVAACFKCNTSRHWSAYDLGARAPLATLADVWPRAG